MCIYVSMGVCAHDNYCLQRLEEDSRYPEAQGRCGFKLPYVGSRNWKQVLYKSSISS